MIYLNEKKWLLFFSDVQPRRHTVIRQVLCNKRTVSSLFWGMQYHILDWLNVEPNLNEQEFDLQITKLRNENYLEVTPTGLVLSPNGIIQKSNYQKSNYIITEPKLFQHINEKQWLDLLPLLIQVVSELSYHNRHYYVVSSSIRTQLFFRAWYQAVNNKEELVTSLKHLLEVFLERFPKKQADIFMSLFSGHKTIGKTVQQVAMVLPDFSYEDVTTLWRDLGMQFALFLLRGDSVFKKLVVPINTEERLSKSASITYQLFNERQNIERIAKRRRLRISTIKEHLLESAILCDKFPYDNLITVEEYEIMTKTFTGGVTNWDYNQLSNRIEFFKYRLFQIERSKKIG